MGKWTKAEAGQFDRAQRILFDAFGNHGERVIDLLLGSKQAEFSDALENAVLQFLYGKFPLSLSDDQSHAWRTLGDNFLTIEQVLLFMKLSPDPNDVLHRMSRIPHLVDALNNTRPTMWMLIPRFTASIIDLRMSLPTFFSRINDWYEREPEFSSKGPSHWKLVSNAPCAKDDGSPPLGTVLSVWDTVYAVLACFLTQQHDLLAGKNVVTSTPWRDKGELLTVFFHERKITISPVSRKNAENLPVLFGRDLI